MPESAMWVLIVSLAMLALGLACKIAEIRHRLKISDNEPLRLRSELDTLKDTHKKEISDIKELHDRVVMELREELNKSIHSSPPAGDKVEYFVVGDHKWKTTIYSDSYYKVDKNPICNAHDLPFVSGSHSRYCPEAINRKCKNIIKNDDLSGIYEIVNSYIDRQIRNKDH